MKKVTIFMLALLLSFGMASGVEWVVEYDDPVNSTNGTPFEGSLQHALMNFSANDVIKFAPVMAGKTIFFQTSWELKKGSVTIDASELTSKVIFDASGKAATPINNILCFFSSLPNNANPATVLTVKNIVFQNLIVSPTTNAEVGCINSKYGSLNVENCDFIDNKLYGPATSSGSYNQGAIIASVTKNNLFVKNCRFVNNTGRKGACVTLWPMAMTVIENCYFSNNSAVSGAACVYSLTSGTTKGAESTVIIRNNVLTGNTGNQLGALILSEAPVTGPYMQLYNNTMVGNTNTLSNSAQIPFVATKYRKMILAGNLFAGNYNQATPPTLNNEIGFAASMSAILPEDSLVLTGYNIFSSPRNYATPITQEKLNATHNVTYTDWAENPLVKPVVGGIMVPTDNIGLYSQYVKVIPSASLTWLGANPLDQRGAPRSDSYVCIGAYEDARVPVTSTEKIVGTNAVSAWMLGNMMHISTSVKQVDIISLSGQHVRRVTNVSAFSLEGLSKGIYLAKIIDNEGLISKIKFRY
ncbi:MAG: T9SS type A sorting domain-containing protein [Paludibacter sp.]|nr:T9SS type A sorting domain-containing protein [Paludibacter sp.]